MLDIANKGRALTEKVQDQLNVLIDVEANERKRLENVLNLFIVKNKGFDKDIPALRRATKEISNSTIRDADLPPEAFFVRGYFSHKIESDYSAAIGDFTKVIAQNGADEDLQAQARFFRGVDHVNIREYKDAIEDFMVLKAKYANNLFYSFWHLEARLMFAREDGGSPKGLWIELAAEFQNILDRVKRPNFTSDPTTRDDLERRVSRSYASLLICQLDDLVTAQTVLSNKLLETDAPSLYLQLLITEKDNKEVLCENATVRLSRFKAAYSATTEPRSKLLRGMIVAKCMAWANQSSELAAFKEEFLAQADVLRQFYGGGISIFSAVSQKNEDINTISEQLISIS